MEPVKVLVVDDSALVRSVFTNLLENERDFELVGTAQDPIIAANKLKAIIPDVIILDVEMPRMDGLTFLRKLMSQHPIPVIICSTLAVSGSDTCIKALEYGAVDIINKPKLGAKQFIEESRIIVLDKIRAAAQSKEHLKRLRGGSAKPRPKLSPDVVLAPSNKALAETTEKVITIGASTGGTEAVRQILEVLPENTPGILVVLHMPEQFTKTYAERLNDCCRITVKEASHGDTVLRGHALVAPGNHHMLLKRSGARYYVEVKDGPLVSRHRPSVDVLFRSAARFAGANAVGVILTGMGDDGALGITEMRKAGANTIAQDEETCVVFGMPKEAIKAGGIKSTLPIDDIAKNMIRM